MKMPVQCLIVSVLCLGLGLSAADVPPEVDALLKKMEEAAGKATSVEADMTTVMKTPQMEMEMKGHFKGMADGKRFAMEATTKTMGMEMKMKMVADGTTAWTEMDMPAGAGGKMVQKYSLKTMEKMGGGQNPMDQAKQMREMFQFTGLKDGKADNVDVHVLEGIPKADDPKTAQFAQMNVKKARMHIGKADLVLRKMEMLTEKDEAVMTMDMTGVKVGQTFPDSIFQYTPPKDVKVMDMDEMLKGLGGAGAASEPVK